MEEPAPKAADVIPAADHFRGAQHEIYRCEEIARREEEAKIAKKRERLLTVIRRRHAFSIAVATVDTLLDHELAAYHKLDVGDETATKHIRSAGAAVRRIEIWNDNKVYIRAQHPQHHASRTSVILYELSDGPITDAVESQICNRVIKALTSWLTTKYRGEFGRAVRTGSYRYE